MYRGRRFLSGFGKTDGRTGGRRAVARTDRTDWRKTDGREDARRTRGRVGRRPGDRPRKRRDREKREREGREGRQREREREREALQRRRFPGASLTLPTSLIAISRERKVGGDGEERGAPAQILSKEGSVAS
ncbi:unnamed protein product [Sphagnum jensenii]|uniref:Uncharacterized protein n=1 Tax=Sphagnum jensenii TaxID=128206 RepID=A0ABP0WPE2_9BRYO